MSLTVYGLKNCDTTRKFLKELRAKKIEHDFKDLREQPPTANQIGDWLKSSFAEKLLNKQSTTWRELNADAKAKHDTASLLMQHPTLFKRPVVLSKGEIIAVGYSPALSGKV